MIELYNSQKEKLAVMEPLGASEKRVLNGEYSLSFVEHENELKSEYFLAGNMIKAGSQFFDIRRVEQEHNRQGIIYKINCEHVNYRLIDKIHETYARIGTPAEILEDILSETEFKAGMVDFQDVITISAQKQINKKELIYQIANLLNGEIEYTENGFTINIRNEIGKNQGFQARLGKNLLGIRKTIDNRGGLKTYYEIELAELKNSNEYKENGLAELEKVEIGDTIRIIDEMMNLNVENRVISIEKNPIAGSVIKIEIANKIELITDKINQIETTVVRQEQLYNHVSISEKYGFRAERSDKRARTTMAGDNIAMEIGDGTGSYTKAMYFDVLTGKYKFIGDIHASGNIIGGTINIGNGTFKVDSNGHVTANSINIGGGRGIRNLSDAGELATKNRINGTYIDHNSISTPHIQTKAVSAEKIDVVSLSAISANIGRILAGEIRGIEIFGTKYFDEEGNTMMILAGQGGRSFVLSDGRYHPFFSVAYIPENQELILTNGGEFFLRIENHGENELVGNWTYKNAEIATISDIPDVHAGGGQTIYFQVYDGHLEYKLAGGQYTALANA